MRLNCRRLGTACLPGRALGAIVLLTIVGAFTLAVGPGRTHWPFANEIQKARPQIASSDTGRTPPGATQVAARIPLIFERNEGQSDPQVKFLVHGAGYNLFLTKTEMVLALHQPRNSAPDSGGQLSRLSMKLVNADSEAEVSGTDELPGKSNYFIGNDPARWHRDVPQFARIRYRNIYPGIDLVYYGKQGRLEYDFEIAAGSDPRHVALRFQGADRLSLEGNGDLVLSMAGGNIRLQSPRVYQKFGEEERAVAGHFKLHGKNEIAFDLGAYDHTRTLIIDPVLSYSTYLGGSGAESCTSILGIVVPPGPAIPGCPAIAVDSAGNAYIAGSTNSTDFPVSSAAYQKTLVAGATANVFIAKFNPAGSALVFATYLGGEVLDYPVGIGVDSNLNVVVAGNTTSTKFPTMNAFQSSPLSGGNHVFVSQLGPAGAKLLYSTYLSGNGIDTATGLALDTSGKVYVTGMTTSPSFPTGQFPTTLGAIQTSPRAINQAFMSKIDPSLSGTSSLAYSTYFGGSSPGNGVIAGGGIAVDRNSNVYITGGTNFTDMPLVLAFQGTLKGTSNVFVAKINPSAPTGSQLSYSTYLGGSGADVGYGIAVDSSSNAYITGSTTSADIAIPSGTTPFQGCLDDPGDQPPKCKPMGSLRDAFLAKLGTPCTGTSCTTTSVPLNYFTYLGGSGDDVGTAVTVDTIQGALITGWSNSNPLATHNTVLQTTYGGGSSDGFVARIDTTATTSTAAGHYISYLGGSGADIGTSIAADPQGNSYVAGETSSTNFPLAAAAFGTLKGPSDAFVSKLGLLPVLAFKNATATPTPVGVGNQVSFAYTISNTGDPANPVIFTDILPSSGATFVSATASPGSCGGAAGGFVSCTLGTLNAGSTGTVTVVLTPTVAGTLSNSGSVSVPGCAVPSCNVSTPPLSATVNDFSISVAPASATAPAGVPATYTATLTPTGNIPESVSISCSSGLPTGATCSVTTNPILNLSNGPVSTVLVINTTARVTTTAHLWQRRGLRYVVWLPVFGLTLLSVGMGGASRKRRVLLGLLLGGFFALIFLQAGCGSKKTISTTTGTPAGKYVITVSATSGSATRTTTTTLVVQ